MKHTKTKYTKTCIRRKCTSTGLSIEETVRQAIATNSPLEGGATPIWTPASDGVVPAYDVRTDKQDLALKAMDKVQKTEAMKGFIKQIELGKDKNGNPTDDKGQEVKPINAE